ncbi:MAG TPA: T9SS type A sorting domain-containing protein [Bacteroidota bacterium]|nr:T9SS type A sorting domain-containing protein [Bacteroidota bacterium]
MKPHIVVLLSCLMAAMVNAGGKLPNASKATSSVSTFRALGINRIFMNVNDRGCLQNQEGWGAYWPDTVLNNPALNYIVYDHGPWIIGKVNGVPSMAMALWGSSFAPGPVLGGLPALWVRPQDSSRYHPYEITYSSLAGDSDVAAWPRDLGAPVDEQGRPLILGDQLVWSIFNGADTTSLPIDYQGTHTQFPHLPVEVRQSVYAWKSASVSDTSLLANIGFLEWKFLNKGTAPIESCYVGFWSDIDFGLPDNNVPGIDTSLQLAYCWAPDTAGFLKETVGAVGYKLMFGPVVPDPGGTAVFCGKTLTGYKNLQLSSFRGIIDDLGHSFISAPNNITECWNVARGFDQSGEIIIDSVTRLPTKFPYSGDPVTRSGWVYSDPWRGGSAGILMFAGPFTLSVGDSQWMMVALIPANAGDRLLSISLLRQYAQRLGSFTYDELAGPRTMSIEPIPPAVATRIALYQNYPNPFNPSTTIQYALPQRSHVSLSVYNTLGQLIATLANGVEQPGYHRVEFNANGLASGVYFYRLQAGAYVATKKLVFVR